MVLQWIKGYKIPLISNDFKNCSQQKLNRSPKETDIISSIILELENKGAISKCSPKEGQFLSEIFLTPKPDGSYRLILNLKRFNKFVEYNHFKLEDWRTATKLIFKNCVMCKIDLKEAYYLVSVAKSHRKFLRFRFKEELIEFNCLPFGLSSAPRVFTKIMKPVIRYFRKLGIICVIYLDDILIIASDFKKCKSDVRLIITFLEKLGFIINYKKSILNPSIEIQYLGFIFNSVEMTIEIPEDKKQKIKLKLQNFLVKSKCKIQELAELLGLLTSCCLAVKYGWKYTKKLERLKYLSLLDSNNNFNAFMKIPTHIHEDLKWWLKTIPISKNSIKVKVYSLEIFSDASLTGWGVSCKKDSTHGFWDRDEQQCSINFLELKAAFFGLKCFADKLKHCNILLRLDSKVAISYINRMGGIKIKRLNEIAGKIWKFCEDRDLWIFASYIRSKENCAADQESRRLEMETEFSLAKYAFNKIKYNFDEPNIDLFASRINKKCRKYISWHKDPYSIAVDAFTLSWKKYFFYAFPPFSIILKTLEKIRHERSRGIVVVPYWPEQSWFPLYNYLRESEMIIFKPNPRLLLSSNREPHPLHRSLTLVAAILSGRA